MKSVRQQRNHELVVQEILNAARAIMRDEGAAGLSMQELARRLDMRAPSLYHYFSGKSEIYDAVFRLGFTVFDQSMAELTAEAETWQEELRHYLTGYMTFALKNPELYQLCFERPVPGFVPSDESLKVSFGALERGYARMAKWQDKTRSNLSNQQMVDLVLAVMHGLTALHIANEPNLPVGEGRFGSLITAAVELFDKAWKRPAELEGEDR